MISKFYSLLAISFPSAYKLFVVLIATTLAGPEVANEFSQGFFWVALLTTFTGLPVASIMMSTEHKLSAQQKYLIPTACSLIVFYIAYIFILKDEDIWYCSAILFATIFLSLHEVEKREHLNVAAFKAILKASLITVILFSISAYFFIGSAPLLLIMYTLLFFIPLLFAKRTNDKCADQATQISLPVAMSHVFKYALSNMFSTSLMCVVPLVLISELGEDFSVQITQIFYMSGVAYLIPRVLSAKHIPDMRLNGINKHNVYMFFFSILIFIFIATLVVWQAVQFFYPESWLAFLLIFIAMQVSQLSLPFVNVLLVCGKSNTIMKNNIISSIILAVFTSITFMMMAKGYDRGTTLLLFFVVFQLIKLILNYTSAAPIFNNTQPVISNKNTA